MLGIYTRIDKALLWHFFMSQVWHHFVCTLTMHLDVIHLRCYSMPSCSLLPHVTFLIQSHMHQIAKYICMIKKWRHRLLFSLKVHQLWSINDIQDRKFLHISSTTQTHSNTLLPFCLFLLQLKLFSKLVYRMEGYKNVIQRDDSTVERLQTGHQDT